jgi:pilus assembly protein Flp/PilA
MLLNFAASTRKNPFWRQEFVVRRLVSKFLRDQSGATAIEYCLIACGIAFAIIAVVQGIGPQLSTKFTAVNSSLK